MGQINNCEKINMAKLSELTVPGKLLPGHEGTHYKWTIPVEIDNRPNEIRFLNIDGEEMSLSDIMFDSPESAMACLEEGHFGYDLQTAKEMNYVLVKVERSFVLMCSEE